MDPSEAARALLVIGDGPQVLPAAERLAHHLQVVLFAPGVRFTADAPPTLRVVGGRIVSVSGQAGDFRAHAAAGGGAPQDMGCFSPHGDGRYDLVLDLGRCPVIADAEPPNGYFAPRDGAGLAAALAALPRLVPPVPAGAHLTFEAAQCAHSRQGLAGCRRCAQVCDAGAIRFEAGSVSVQADSCNGCAACALACPTGALSPARALRERMLAALQEAIRSGEPRTAPDPVLAVHTRGTPLPADLPASLRALEVPALPAFGDELWFAAWAAGFRTVLLVDDPSMAAGARCAIDAALVQSRALAAAAGRGDLRVALVAPEGLQAAAAPSGARRPHAAPAGTAADRAAGKRDMAAASLLRIARPRAGRAAALPARSTFGSVRVDTAACTLCLACANACPTHALAGSESGAIRRLSLRESACVRCGLCAAACPEQAIALQESVTLAHWAVPRELAQDRMMRCGRCHAAFMPRRLHDRVSPLAAAAPPLLCPACRPGASFH